MRLTALKPLRVAISLILFFLVLYLFMDISGRITHEITRGILFFQFVPAAVTFVHLSTAAALGVPFVLVLTLLFGRVYCSFFCPLGTLQDFIIGIKTRLRIPVGHLRAVCARKRQRRAEGQQNFQHGFAEAPADRDRGEVHGGAEPVGEPLPRPT